MKTPFFFPFFFLLLSACQSSTPISTSIEQGYPVTRIDLNQPIDSMTLPLSGFGKNLKLVSLETIDSSLFGSALYLVTDRYIVVASEGILLFDKAGKFVKRLANKGRGPGECGLVSTLRCNREENTVYALDYNNNIHSWTIPEGKYHKVPISQDGYPHSIKILNDTTIAIGNFREHKASYVLSVQSIDGKFHYGLPKTSDADQNILSYVNNLFGEDASLYYRPHRTDSIYLVQQDHFSLAYYFPLKTTQELNIQVIHHNYIYCSVFNITDTHTQTGEVNGNKITSTSYDGFNNYYLIDLEAKNLKFFRHIQNDYLGGILEPGEIILQNNNLFYIAYPSVQLLQNITEQLEDPELKPEIRQRLEILRSRVSEEQNPHLLIGELNRNIITH